MLYTADFETTTNEEDCRVWAWGVCEIGNEDFFEYGNDIDTFMTFVENSKNSTFYFHNLKFDGEFILVWLFEHGFKYEEDKRNATSKSFTTLISDMGQFYTMTIYFKRENKMVKSATFIDSLKILPFSVSDIAKGFGLPISKLEIDYKEERKKGHVLTQKEVDYLRNDVDIVARALWVLFDQGLTKMTQGSNALFDYKRSITKKQFESWFPTPDYDKDIRASYKGGFTYLNPKYKNADLGEMIVLDVNSLYPSVMRNRPLPYDEGIHFRGEYKPDKLYNLYVQFFTCQFELKEGYIPTIQLKNNLSFIPTQYLTSSEDEEVTMCLTSVDMELFKEHYHIYNIVYHYGWKFKSATGQLFADYIDKWTKVKIESTLNGNKSMRSLAKLMLNALYGKFSTSPVVQSKHPYYDNGVIKYRMGEKEERRPLYIPVGTFVTSWARYTTIKGAQQLYDNFVYADTDSLHIRVDLPEEVRKLTQKEMEALTTEDLRKYGVNIPETFEVDPVKLGAWKVEERTERARYIRQKSYIHDYNKPETWNTDEYDPTNISITCAGMPANCYQYVTWENFKEGSTFAGKLQPKHVKGGIVLKDIEYSIKPS